MRVAGPAGAAPLSSFLSSRRLVSVPHGAVARDGCPWWWRQRSVVVVVGPSSDEDFRAIGVRGTGEGFAPDG